MVVGIEDSCNYYRTDAVFGRRVRPWRTLPSTRSRDGNVALVDDVKVTGDDKRNPRCPGGTRLNGNRSRLACRSELMRPSIRGGRRPRSSACNVDRLVFDGSEGGKSSLNCIYLTSNRGLYDCDPLFYLKYNPSRYNCGVILKCPSLRRDSHAN